MDRSVTKILFVDNDELSFQVRQCIARVIEALPPIELFHASDATEGLQMLENVKPDVVILDQDSSEETDLFIESLHSNHPPIIVQTNTAQSTITFQREVTKIEKNESIEGIHQTLVTATSLAIRTPTQKDAKGLH